MKHHNTNNNNANNNNKINIWTFLGEMSTEQSLYIICTRENAKKTLNEKNAHNDIFMRST